MQLNCTGLEFQVYFRISYDTLWAMFLFRIFENVFMINLLPPQGFGPEVKTRGGTLGFPARNTHKNKV